MLSKSRFRYHSKIILLSVLILFTSASYSLAYNTDKPYTKLAPFKISGLYLTKIEYMALPTFLKVKVQYHIGGKPPIYKKWEARMGVDYQHYHHWAGAIVKFSRAMESIEKSQRLFYLRISMHDYNYLLRHCQKNNRYRYLFHFRRGEIYNFLEKKEDAAREYITSIKINKKFKQAYLNLSTIYNELGMPAKAQETLNKMNSF